MHKLLVIWAGRGYTCHSDGGPRVTDLGKHRCIHSGGRCLKYPLIVCTPQAACCLFALLSSLDKVLAAYFHVVAPTVRVGPCTGREVTEEGKGGGCGVAALRNSWTLMLVVIGGTPGTLLRARHCSELASLSEQP